jgi:predicted RNase H-like nuclease
MLFLGVDGCRGGWLAIKIALDNSWEVNLFGKFSQLWDEYGEASLFLVDIPIGLRQGSPKRGSPERAERRCDREARKLLGKRGSCVFRVPCRPAIYAGSYDQALARNEKLTGTRIFKATWNIVAKIREVDELLTTNLEARTLVREIHPELCFWSLNSCRPLKYSKTKKEGHQERLELLQSFYPQSKTLLDHTLSTYLRKEVKKDDILDALCAALTARVGYANLSAIPRQPERDREGLPMEMVYCLFSLFKEEYPWSLNR